MLGVSGRVANASGGAASFVITQGSDVDFVTQYGYWNDPYALGLTAPFGSISPQTIFGKDIGGAVMVDGATDYFGIWIATSLPQDFFHSLEPEGAGVLLSADADDFTPAASYTYWRWNLSIPAAWDGTGDVTLDITR